MFEWQRRVFMNITSTSYGVKDVFVIKFAYSLLRDTWACFDGIDTTLPFARSLSWWDRPFKLYAFLWLGFEVRAR